MREEARGEESMELLPLFPPLLLLLPLPELLPLPPLPPALLLPRLLREGGLFVLPLLFGDLSLSGLAW